VSNPYSSVAIANFNTDPPIDDASEISSNELEWKKHLDKHATPLKNLAESINTNVAAAFGKRFGTTFELKTTNYSIAAPGDQGKFFSVTGTTTITLPLVADAGDGFPVAVINNGSATVTVDTTASELIDGSTSFTLAANDWALLTTDGSTWTAAIVVAPNIETGTFVATWNGFTTSPTTTWTYTKSGNIVTIRAGSTLQATSNTAFLQSGVTDVPASIRPTVSNDSAYIVEDNGTKQMGIITVTAAGRIQFNADVGSGSFTASGNKGFLGLQVFAYSLD